MVSPRPRGRRVRPVPGRARVWSPWQPDVLERDSKSLRQWGGACRLNDCRTTRRIINKRCMKNYIYPSQPVRCVGVSRKVSVWFNFSFVGHNFMLFQFLMRQDVWFDSVQLAVLSVSRLVRAWKKMFITAQHLCHLVLSLQGWNKGDNRTWQPEFESFRCPSALLSVTW